LSTLNAFHVVVHDNKDSGNHINKDELFADELFWISPPSSDIAFFDRPRSLGTWG
jgi:hypothetical protein